MERVNHVFPLLLIANQFRVTQHGKVTRYVNQFSLKKSRQFSYIHGARYQTLNDPKAFRVGQRFQIASAIGGFEPIIHFEGCL
jgi:hypothetical protein